MNDETVMVMSDLAKGLVVGVLATWAMEKVTGFLWEHENEEARKQYEEVTEGRYPPMRMAEKTNDLLNLGLSDDQRPYLAQGFHWSYGLGAASVYALLRRRVPVAAAGQGLLFGAAFSLVGDEIFTSATALAESPRQYPWQAHARGLAGHLAFGLVAHTALDLLDRAA
jgi:hypothetical protein